MSFENADNNPIQEHSLIMPSTVCETSLDGHTLSERVFVPEGTLLKQVGGFLDPHSRINHVYYEVTEIGHGTKPSNISERSVKVGEELLDPMGFGVEERKKVASPIDSTVKFGRN